MPQSALEQVYKSFIRPVIEYADVIYSMSPFDRNNGKPNPLSEALPLLMDKLESIQYCRSNNRDMEKNFQDKSI
jgi:hypothetical protein